HLPYACVLLPGRSDKQCVPSIPFVTPCDDTSTCMGDLTCQAVASLPDRVCTKSCSGASDCAADPALGSSFTCAGGVCVARTEWGCNPAADLSELCLSGHLVGGICVSPPGWRCDRDAQCQSGMCANGRCR